ncbi:MAG TPA: hypothetical protein VFA75_00305 [Nevskia sp.]|nr:hypothetical protein [Nevskia sp.]
MRAAFMLGALAVAFMASAAPPEACTLDNCNAGTPAVTVNDKQDSNYACPTRELATYTSTVLSFAIIGASIGGMPNISDTTGEPEFTGNTKNIVDGLRAAAGVSSFDEAVAMCAPIKHNRHVTIINHPSNALVVYVVDSKTKLAYWIPLSSLDKLK